jgi:hypothetical protein
VKDMFELPIWVVGIAVMIGAILAGLTVKEVFYQMAGFAFGAFFTYYKVKPCPKPITKP